MIRRLLRLRRHFGFVTLAIGTFATTALPLADSYAESVSATAQSHVEEAGAKGCPQVHNDATCQLCRVLRLDGRRPEAVSFFATENNAVTLAFVATAHFQSRSFAPSAAPRAPPLA